MQRRNKGNISLEAVLVFAAAALFWVVVFRSIAPYLLEAKEKASESVLVGECEKLAGLVDALSSYGRGVYVDYAPFVNGDVFFCQNAAGFCRSREIFAVKVLDSGEVKKASCSTHVAEWVNLKYKGELLSCEKAISGHVRMVNITFATYDEKSGKKRECE